jgi:hypothetical protein
MGQLNQDWYGVDGKKIDERYQEDIVNDLY